jgi:hypothetical protein
MKPSPRITTWIALALCLQAVIAPRRGWSQETSLGETAKAAFISDVRLDRQGCLHVCVVDANGARCSDRPLEAQIHGTAPLSARTDARGEALVPLTRGCVVLVVCGEQARLCRVWTAEAAPPAATDGVLIVENAMEVVRGHRNHLRELYDFFECRPLLAYSLAALAIALPIALIADDDDVPASP